MERLKDILWWLGALLTFFGLCMALFKPREYVESVKIVEKVDTIVQVVTEERVVYRDVVRTDTVWLTRVRTDTLKIHDTVRVLIPIERKVYEDSLYRAVVSGYKPSLDSMIVYPRTRVVEVTKVEKPRKVSIGATVGPQVGVYRTMHGWQAGLGVGVTIGVSFDLRRHK